MRMAATPLANVCRSMLDDHVAPGVQGGRHAPVEDGDGDAGAGDTRQNRTQVACPSNVTTTTHQPVESNAVRSSVRSARSVNSRPPTRAVAASSAADRITP